MIERDGKADMTRFDQVAARLEQSAEALANVARRIYSPIHENLLKSRDFELMKPIKNHIGLVKNAMRTDR
jgi:hypothetical protein